MIDVDQFTRIVVLTGAGISAESGLKTFRDNNGLWENHRVEEVATPEAFHANPALVYRFYNERRRQLLSDEVSYNNAHRALADFEQRGLGSGQLESFCLVTQNVDDLHIRSGSKNVFSMHGQLLESLCSSCGYTNKCMEDINGDSICEACGEQGSVRPNIVWFGEMPYFMAQIESQILACDLFVAVGTSGVVYPAAGFQQVAQRAGAVTIELNLEAGETASYFDHSYYGPATTLLPKFFKI